MRDSYAIKSRFFGKTFNLEYGRRHLPPPWTVPGVSVPPRDIGYYRSVQQCEHARAALERRWAEITYTCLMITR
jgi:hypothetical protein